MKDKTIIAIVSVVGYLFVVSFALIGGYLAGGMLEVGQALMVCAFFTVFLIPVLIYNLIT